MITTRNVAGVAVAVAVALTTSPIAASPTAAATASTPTGHAVSIPDVTLIQGGCAPVSVTYTLPTGPYGEHRPSWEGFQLYFFNGPTNTAGAPLLQVDPHETYFSPTRYEQVPATYNFRTGDNIIGGQLCDYASTATSGTQTARVFGTCNYTSSYDYFTSATSACSTGLSFGPLDVPFNVTVTAKQTPPTQSSSAGKKCATAKKQLRKAKQAKPMKTKAHIKRLAKKVKRVC